MWGRATELRKIRLTKERIVINVLSAAEKKEKKGTKEWKEEKNIKRWNKKEDKSVAYKNRCWNMGNFCVKERILINVSLELQKD